MAAQPYLDPLNQVLAEASASMPAMETLSIPDFRKLLMQFNTHEQLPGVDRNMIQVPIANGTETWIYRPEGSQGPLPYIFFVHGGGFVAGNISVYDSIATDLVLRTGYSLVFPEYKLAPEAQWPEQQEQCYQILQWIIENGTSHNLESENFALVGDSAAGIHVFDMNVYAQRDNLHIPFNVLLNAVESLDYLAKPSSSRWELWNGPYLTVAALRHFIDQYLPPSVDRTSELANPSNVSEATAKAFAPTLIITGSADVLRDEAEQLGEKLQQAGRDVSIFRTHGQLHDSMVLDGTRSGPTPKMIMTLISAALKERLG